MSACKFLMLFSSDGTERGSSRGCVGTIGTDLNVPEAAEMRATAGRRYFEKVMATGAS